MLLSEDSETLSCCKPIFRESQQENMGDFTCYNSQTTEWAWHHFSVHERNSAARICKHESVCSYHNSSWRWVSFQDDCTSSLGSLTCTLENSVVGCGRKLSLNVQWLEAIPLHYSLVSKHKSIQGYAAINFALPIWRYPCTNEMTKLTGQTQSFALLSNCQRKQNWLTAILNTTSRILKQAPHYRTLQRN